jgi:hypothetical protein
MVDGRHEVNAVERVHSSRMVDCVPAHRAWKSAGDPSIMILPPLGICGRHLRQWLQWFIPYRVGEAHDVSQLASIVCGLLFALAVQPPAAFSSRLSASSWRRIGIASAIVWLIFATFVSQVHLGHMISVPEIGRFKSHYTADELNALQGHRAALWQTQPPINIARLSREDQYLDEGLWHVRKRNSVEEISEAWRENLILERFRSSARAAHSHASPKGIAGRRNSAPTFLSAHARSTPTSVRRSRTRLSCGQDARSGRWSSWWRWYWPSLRSASPGATNNRE